MHKQIKRLSIILNGPPYRGLLPYDSWAVKLIDIDPNNKFPRGKGF